MTQASNLLGIPSTAVGAYISLCAAIERLAESGRKPVCVNHPGEWDADAKPAARAEAAEACGYCPLLDHCSAYAEAAQEKHGVWAGVDRTPRAGRPAKSAKAA